MGWPDNLVYDPIVKTTTPRGLTSWSLSKLKHVTLFPQRKYLEFIKRNQYHSTRDLVLT